MARALSPFSGTPSPPLSQDPATACRPRRPRRPRPRRSSSSSCCLCCCSLGVVYFGKANRGQHGPHQQPVGPARLESPIPLKETRTYIDLSERVRRFGPEASEQTPASATPPRKVGRFRPFVAPT